MKMHFDDFEKEQNFSKICTFLQNFVFGKIVGFSTNIFATTKSLAIFAKIFTNVKIFSIIFHKTSRQTDK